MIIQAPGSKPEPDNQGNASTCTRHALAKALTAGLDNGRFGMTLDVKQDYVTQALINKTLDVGGRWPTAFDQKTILVFEENSKEYYEVSMKVAVCKNQELVQKFNTSMFVAVYKRFGDNHCVFVNKLANGNFCCINSHGQDDPYPQIYPSKCKVYMVDATVRRASDKEHMSTRKSSIGPNRLIAMEETILKQEKRIEELESKLYKQSEQKKPKRFFKNMLSKIGVPFKCN